jgi:hypothetical protein
MAAEMEPRMDTDAHGLRRDNVKTDSSSEIGVHPRSSVVPLLQAQEEFIDFEERWCQ